MEELKEDYSDLNREEALELAEEWLEKSKILVEAKHQYLEAVDLVKKAIVIFEKWKVSDLFSDANEMHIAFLFKSIDHYKQGRQFSKVLVSALKWIELIEKNHATDPIRLNDAYSSMGQLCIDIGDSNRSIEYFEKSIQQAILIENQSALLNAYCDLSAGCSICGEIDRAISLSKKALEIHQKMGTDGFFMNEARIYHNLAVYHRTLQDFKQQILYYQKCLKIIREHLGEEHERVILVQQNLGVALMDMQRMEEALPYLQNCLNIRQKLEDESIYTSLGYLSTYYFNKEDYALALEYAKRTLTTQLKTLDKNHPNVVNALVVYGNTLSFMGRIEEATQILEKSIAQTEQIWGVDHLITAETYLKLASHFLRIPNTQKATRIIQKAEYILLQKKKADLNSLFKQPDHQLFEIQSLKATTFFQHYLQQTQSFEDLQTALISYQKASELFYKIQQNALNEDSKLFRSATKAKLFESGIIAALEMNVFDENFQAVAFHFSEKAKASLLLISIQGESAKTSAKIPIELQQMEKGIKLKLTHLDKCIQQLQLQKEKMPLEEWKEKRLQDCQDDFFHLHQKHTTFLEQLETNYPDYYQFKYYTKTVTPTELQSTLKENQVVLSYFVGEDKLYIFVVTPDDFEVIDLQLPADFEALIQNCMSALTQHQFASFGEKSHQLYQLLIRPIRDFIVDDFGFDDELKQVFVIPHGVLSYVPFEALIRSLPKPLARSEVVAKVSVRTEALPTISNFGNSWSGNVWNGLDYLIHHCEVSYHYSATLLHHHLLKKQNGEEFPNSFAGFAPIYDTASPAKSPAANLPESEEIDALQQSARAMQSWATRSDAIRSDGTWVSLPHSETEAIGIAQLFEEKGLEAEIFLREKASKEGFAEAAKRFKFLLVAAHGLVNDEKTVLSGLVFYPNTLNVERQTVDETEQNIRSSHSLSLTNHEPPITNHQTDSVLSMEETHHLDLQADLVVLSSCESGIGTLHKGEGMMAVNRGFLAAGANNVVSTLFKVYDKPSSLLTQYLFEGILEGKNYAAALRLAKLKLMKQPNIDPKSWSGFVLIGG